MKIPNNITINWAHNLGFAIVKPMFRPSSMARLTKRLTSRSIILGNKMYQRFNSTSDWYKRRPRPHSLSQLPLTTLIRKKQQQNVGIQIAMKNGPFIYAKLTYVHDFRQTTSVPVSSDVRRIRSILGPSPNPILLPLACFLACYECDGCNQATVVCVCAAPFANMVSSHFSNWKLISQCCKFVSNSKSVKRRQNYPMSVRWRSDNPVIRQSSGISHTALSSPPRRVFSFGLLTRSGWFLSLIEILYFCEQPNSSR